MLNEDSCCPPAMPTQKSGAWVVGADTEYLETSVFPPPCEALLLASTFGDAPSPATSHIWMQTAWFLVPEPVTVTEVWPPVTPKTL